jgi:hypothetical protein
MSDEASRPRPDRNPRPRRRGRITTLSPSSHTEDQYLLQRAAGMPPADDSWRALRILSEFVDGFGALASIPPALTVSGSARIGADDPIYRAAVALREAAARAGFAVITGGGPGIMEAANRAGARGAACRSAATSSCRTSSESTVRGPRHRLPVLLRAQG